MVGIVSARKESQCAGQDSLSGKGQRIVPLAKWRLADLIKRRRNRDRVEKIEEGDVLSTDHCGWQRADGHIWQEAI